MILGTASSSGLFHVPSQPMRMPSPRGNLRHDSCHQPDTRNLYGTTGNVSEDPLAANEPTAACFGSARSLADTHCELVSLNTGRLAARTDESERNTQNFALHRDLSGSFQHGIRYFMQKEFKRKIVWFTFRGIRSRKCITINSLTVRHLSVDTRVSRPRYGPGCKDCIHREEITMEPLLQEESQSGGPEGSNGRPILSWKTDCVHDLPIVG